MTAVLQLALPQKLDAQRCANRTEMLRHKDELIMDWGIARVDQGLDRLFFHVVVFHVHTPLGGILDSFVVLWLWVSTDLSLDYVTSLLRFDECLTFDESCFFLGWRLLLLREKEL